MKTNLLLPAVILIISSCSGNKVKSDLATDNLKGAISKMTITQFSATEKFGEPYKEKKNSATTLSYNKDGNVIKQDALYTLDSTEAEHVVYEMQYNNKGQKISVRNTKNPKPNGFYKYGPDGLVSEFTNFDEKGVISGKTTFTYTDNLTSSETSYDDKGKVEQKIVYKRNSQGLVEEYNEYDATGTLKNKMLQTYNSDNLLDKVVGSMGTYKFTATFKYFNKDEKGNYLKIIGYDETNKPKKITERKIEYF